MKEKSIWIILSLCLGLFIVITILLFNGKIIVFDNHVYNYLINFESDFLTSYFKFITKFANTITIFILCGLSLLTLFFKKKSSLYLVGTVLISTIINLGLKHSIARIRPQNINMIIETGYSFPSGHAMASVSFYGFLIYLIINSKLSAKLKWLSNIFLLILIINICLSRIYLGVHYASDVICGILISISLLLTVTYILKKYQGGKL